MRNIGKILITITVYAFVFVTCFECSKSEGIPGDPCDKVATTSRICDKIKTELKIGMSLNEVVKVMKPAKGMMAEIPAIYYKDDEDIGYYLTFIDIDSEANQSERGLTAVFIYRKDLPVTYLLPENKSGKIHSKLEDFRRRISDRRK